MFRELTYKAQITLGRIIPQRNLDLAPASGSPPRGRALVSYLPLPLIGDPGLFRGHSNIWECSEIVNIFNRMGYTVDLINWQDSSFAPARQYDIVFDIHRNLLRYSGETTLRIFHVTGSHPEFSNRAEQQRLDALQERRGIRLQRRRSFDNDDQRLFSENLQAADMITLIGNEVTASTFPAAVQTKIRRVSATGSFAPPLAGPPVRGQHDEFLWFNGAGAVHKGLDLVLEVFARNPQLTLHVVGPYAKEHDFFAAYHHELTNCPNIRSHGFLYPNSNKFRKILAQVRAFVNPTCSEGISTSSITCMQYGLIPILSKQAGITLPPAMGRTLENCSLEQLEQAVLDFAGKHPQEIDVMMGLVRGYAQSAFSRPVFSSHIEQALSMATTKHLGAEKC